MPDNSLSGREPAIEVSSVHLQPPALSPGHNIGKDVVVVGWLLFRQIRTNIVTNEAFCENEPKFHASGGIKPHDMERI